ncbi:MAG: complex I subunit 5 family protein [Sphingorhabdus sp.]
MVQPARLGKADRDQRSPARVAGGVAMSGGIAIGMIVMVPLVPLILCLLHLSINTRSWLPGVAIFTPVPALIAALFVPDTVFRLPWLMLDSSMGLDATGRTFLLLFAMLWLIATWHAFFYLRRDERRASFTFWMVLAMAGNFGTALAQDAFSFYLFFSMMSLASYGLVIHDRAPTSLLAGRVYIAVVVAGELALFAGIMLVVSNYGGIASFENGLGPVSDIAFALIAFGLASKAGIFPLHFWLPLAHPAAPAPASAVLSGAMIKVGLLGAIRFLLVPEASGIGEIILWLGGFTALYGVILGVLQTNPKALLGYSSVSQMGLIAIGFGLALSTQSAPIKQAAIAATMLMAVHHGFAKAALFIGSVAAPGSVTGWQRSWRLLALAIPAAALAGAPLTSGAIAKAALKGIAYGPLWVDVFLSLSSATTTILMLRFIRMMWSRQGDEHSGTTSTWIAAVALCLSFFWIWPASAIWTAYSLSYATIISAIWPLLLGALLGLIVDRCLRGRNAAMIPPGDIAIPALRVNHTITRDSFKAPKLKLPLWNPRDNIMILERLTQRWAIGASLAVAFTALLLAELWAG